MNCPQLKLENQLCFPLYAASKEITRRYAPYLEPLDLTYTQYIVMLVLWEEKKCNVSELGKKLFLDSGTLTPLLKKLEAKGYIQRTREQSDERCLSVSLTAEGESLKRKAASVPSPWQAASTSPKQRLRRCTPCCTRFWKGFNSTRHELLKDPTTKLAAAGPGA